jgi:hypothetical protein
MSSFNQDSNSGNSKFKIAIYVVSGLFVIASIWSLIISVSNSSTYDAAENDQIDQANSLVNANQSILNENPLPDPTATIANAATAALATQVSTLQNELQIQRRETAQLEQELQSSLDRIAIEQREASLKSSQDIARVVTLIEGQFDKSAEQDRTSVITNNNEDLIFEDSGGLLFEGDGGESGEVKSQQIINRPVSSYKMFRSSRAPSRVSVDSDLLPTINDDDEPEESEMTIELPATSFANAETLYGVSCPIVSNVVAGVQASGGGMRVPVVIPVRSSFRGPNGDIENVGTANILADCYGQRTSDSNIGRAVLELKMISFVDNMDDKHWKPINGVVIDKKTEAIYIEGPIDKARTSNIWTRAMNAAISTAAFGFSAQGVVLTKGDGAGGYEQSFSGDPVKDMAAQGIGGYFNDLQSGFAEMMNAAVDTVGVPSGRDIKVVLTTPVSFKIKVKTDDLYSSQNAYLF